MGTPPPELVVGDGPTESDLPPVVYDDDAAPEDRLAAIAETAREYDMPEVADALADGEITVAEMRQAYQDALDCMVEQGMEVAQFEEYEGLYGTTFTFIVGWGSLGQEDASRVSTECERRYITFLVHFASPIANPERFTDRARAVLQECLAEHGVTDDVGDTLDELREVAPSQEVVLECTTRAENKPEPPPDVMGAGPSGR